MKRPPSRAPRPSRAPSALTGEDSGDEISSTRALVLAERAPSGLPFPPRLPLLPLRTDVVFPQTVVPLVVNRPSGIKLIDDVLPTDKMLGLVTQRDPELEQPG